VEEGHELFGESFGQHYVGDLAQHLLDVLVALGRPEVLDADALAHGLDFYVEDLDERLRANGLGLVLDLGDERRRLGTEPATATVRTTPIEAFRAIGGRRDDGAVRALDWQGDVEPVIRVLRAYP
jgi:hypothetical protein